MKRLIAFLLVCTLILGSAEGKGGRSFSSGRSSGGSRSFSSGSSRSSSPSRSWSSGSSKPAAPSRSFSSGSKPAAPVVSKPSGSSWSWGSGQKKTGAVFGTPSPKFDTAASSAQKQTQSKKAFLGSKPKPAGYTTHAPSSVRERIQRRHTEFYSNLPPTSVVQSHHHYNDGFSNTFWQWMMLQSLSNQAASMYHHRDNMDAARYNELLASNSALRDEVNKLEKAGLARDPNFKPSNLPEPELMYKVPKEQTHWIRNTVLALLAICFVGVTVYICFFYKAS